MKNQIRPALSMFVILSALTGLAYPLLVTGVSQVAFPQQANGSLIVHEGKPLGSALIGQNFTEPRYFWGRPSATANVPYNAAASGGSNLGPLNPAQKEAVEGRVKALHDADPTHAALIPADLVTASASGLDPHISPAAAYWQLQRVARARDLSALELRKLIDAHTEQRQWGLLGEARVNVLALNMALDQLQR
ncbi:MAG: potassium-transporting ATPase subunit KdpC [Pseudomonadota bacterium]